MCPCSLAVAGDRTLAFSWTQRGGSQSPASGVWSPALSGHGTAALASPRQVTCGFWGFLYSSQNPRSSRVTSWLSKFKRSLGKKKQIRGNTVNLAPTSWCTDLMLLNQGEVWLSRVRRSVGTMCSSRWVGVFAVPVSR